VTSKKGFAAVITPDLCFGFLGGLLTGLLVFVVTFLVVYMRRKDK
jgi:hypothetical protein